MFGTASIDMSVIENYTRSYNETKMNIGVTSVLVMALIFQISTAYNCPYWIPQPAKIGKDWVYYCICTAYVINSTQACHNMPVL